MKSKIIRKNIKKSGKFTIYSSNDKVTIRCHKQSLGTIALMFKKADGTEVVLKQWELELNGETLTNKVVK